MEIMLFALLVCADCGDDTRNIEKCRSIDANDRLSGAHLYFVNPLFSSLLIRQGTLSTIAPYH